MNNADELTPHEGGCQGGKVRFRVTVNRHQALDCNCSICRKKGFLHLIVPPEQFTLLGGADRLTSYGFNTHTARHTFCRICGIHPFYHPRSHPHGIDVNIRCLDGEALSRFESQFFDGANWEENIAKILNPDPPDRGNGPDTDRRW